MDELINALVIIMLIEMMVAIGLGAPFAELLDVARNRRLVFQAALASYVCVPAVTVGLLRCSTPPIPWSRWGFSSSRFALGPRLAPLAPESRTAMSLYPWG